MTIAAIAIGAAAGAGSGLVSGFLSSIAVLYGKGVRNARLVARGEPGIKDCIRTPFEIPYAIIGLLAGGVTGIFTSWQWSIAAGAALPVLWTILGVSIALAQSIKR